MIIVGIVLVVIVCFLLGGLRIIGQWERGLVFRFGKAIKEVNVGLNWVIPLIDSIKKVDIRILTMDVKPQEIMTKDSVPTKIDAVVYYKVIDITKALLEAEDYEKASTLMAQSKLRDIIGKYDLDTLLSKKDTIGKEVLEVLQKPTDKWGVNVESVEIKNIEIPDNMKRAMAKEAEAMREKRARITKAEAEQEASKKFKEAADTISSNPTALMLRQLQTWQEIGAEQNSLIILVPTEFANMLSAIKK